MANCGHGSGESPLKIGFRITAIIGGASLVIGGLMFVFLSPEMGPVWAALASFFVGVGMGMTTTSFIVSIQSTVGWEQRGVATAANMFMRNLGNTIGAALLGGILNSQLLSYIKKQGETVSKELSLDAANILLNEEQRSALSPGVKSVLQEGLTFSIHTVYITVFIFALLSFMLILFYLRRREKHPMEDQVMNEVNSCQHYQHFIFSPF